MTATQSTKVTAPVEDLGRCVRVLDTVNELICNRQAVAEVMVRNKFGLFAVALCEDCKQTHARFYADLRRNHNNRSGHRTRRSTPRMGD